MKDTYEIVYSCGEAVRVRLFDVTVVSDYFAPGSTERTSLLISVAESPLVNVYNEDVFHYLDWFNEVPLGQFEKQLAVTYNWFERNQEILKCEKTSISKLIERIRVLGTDELAIIDELVGRIEKGRKSYGPWSLDKVKDYPQEVIEEVLDALNYCAAELLRLRRQRKLLPASTLDARRQQAATPKAGDELPWAPEHIKRAPREPQQAKPVRSGGIEEFDARWRAQVR